MSKAERRVGRPFFERDTPLVAREMLGMVLVRRLPGGEILRGRVVETEAYHGHDDSASHARSGPEGRASVMFGEAGHAYIYLIYGMYDMLNISTGQDGFPAAILIRALEPLSGIETMRRFRDVRLRNLTNGPGKLCQALAIDRSLNGEDVTTSETLWFEHGALLPDEQLDCSPRIGIEYAMQEHRDRLWRFFLRGNSWVSR